MARVLVVMMPAEGHINPSLGLIKELVENGDEVVYCCTEKYRTKIEQIGVQFRAYSFNEATLMNNPDMKPFEIKHPYQFIYMILKHIIQRFIPDVLKLTENETYDYIIFDSLIGWGGQILGEKLGIPTVCSTTTFVFVELLGSGNKLDDDDDEVKELYNGIMELSQQLAAQFNVAAPSLDELAGHPGQLKIVYTSRYFQPMGDTLDDSFVFTGPSIITRKDAPAFAYEPLHAPYKQTVYISMGTILNKDLDFYKLCFTAFHDLPVQFILSSGKDTDLEPVADLIPDNFIIRPYVPQLEVLQRVDAFLTHAGMNSTSEALYYNVPLIMLPLTSDQPRVASRVKELGAGVIVDKNNLTLEVLRNAVLEVLGNASYREQAGVIGETLREAGGYKQAAAAIGSFLGNRRLSTAASSSLE
ncbi:macrolide family glycosyltransferase [Paenibacillus sp. Leaf72]|uniref:macrolide family glycosyltransferase n=1 Tax=Paenibacillus sp. Leaf72 TaxID=1736234 RepID=UPI000701F626|nr:macrolide family glycosyltransferase [Paenibacillus sp. Leaf72]KQO18702.1 glycosyl transferase [Paenibacillus sp. Leaf72]